MVCRSTFFHSDLRIIILCYTSVRKIIGYRFQVKGFRCATFLSAVMGVLYLILNTLYVILILMYLAIDIGGTKTLVGRFTNDGILRDSVKFPTPRDYDDFLKELAKTIVGITTHKWTLCCVAAPGRIDQKTEVVLGFGNLPWKNVDIRSDVQKMTKTQTLIQNDTKLAGLSEARLLNPIRRKALYLTVSTGISTALIAKGKLDPELIDSEAGQMVFEKDGKIVTWESFASGKAIVNRFHKRASDINDPHVWQIISKDIALGLIDVIANVQPDIVIIGGGVGSHFKKYGNFLKNELKKYESPLVSIPELIGAKRAEEAVIYGCYELMRDNG